MSGVSFREITNSAAVIYALFFISVILTYIAFYRQPRSSKESKQSPK